MSVRIRLAKTGKKHQISFRIVAADSRSKRNGKFLEILGFYNPQAATKEQLKIKGERFNAWLAKGAQPTEAVVKLLSQADNQRQTSKT